VLKGGAVVDEKQLFLDGQGLTIDELVRESVRILRENEPPEGYYGCFSGGKDSILVKRMAEIAKVRVAWHHNLTTIDPPEMIRHMREHYRDVKIHRPPKGNFFIRMERKKGFPTRRVRWCCEEYKESCNPRDATLLMGIRAEESAKRKKRWSHVQKHWRTGSMVVQPILDWPAEELWEFIRGEGLPYPSLYDEGFHRLGCIGCPMAREAGRLKEFERWPRYEKRWKLSFQRLWARRAGTLQRNGLEWFGSARFESWEAMWDWWLHDRPLPPKTPEEPLFESIHDELVRSGRK